MPDTLFPDHQADAEFTGWLREPNCRWRRAVTGQDLRGCWLSLIGYLAAVKLPIAEGVVLPSGRSP